MTLPLTNQGFDSDISGWTASENPATFEWVDGTAHVVAGITSGGIHQSLGSLIAGTEVTIRYKVTDAGVANYYARLSGASVVSGAQYSAPGMHIETLVVPTTGTWVLQVYTGIGGEYYLDYIIARTNMAGFFTTQMQDRDDDMRQFTLPTTQVSAANHDAQYALAGALVTAIEGISRLTTRQWDFGARRTETGDPKPTAGSAQVNIEWQVTYVEDTTLEVRTVRIGGANLDISGILLAGSNVADLTATEMAAFVTAFEAYVVGPNGNAVTVSQVAFLE